MKLQKFIRECREHNVLKNLSIYIVSSWVFLQVIDLIVEPLGFSNKLVAYCLIGLLIGFPLYIYGVWKFQLARTIEQKPLLDAEGNPIAGKFKKSKFRKLYFSFLGIISLVCLGIALFLINKNLVGAQLTADWDGTDKIAVLRFENLTGKDSTKMEVIGEMAVDWIIHGITRNNLAQVISPQIIEDYSRVLRGGIPTDENNTVLSEYLKPSRIIEGDYYLDGDRLLFQCSITDAVQKRTLISFEPISCDSSSPLDCIESMNQRILGYLITEANDALNLEDRPPTFEAYQTFQRAKAFQGENDSLYLSYLGQSIEFDPNYFEPRIYRFMHFYNQGEYRIADSLLTELHMKSGFYERQKILLNIYDALLRGDHRNAFRYQRQEYNITPFHLETNSNMMIISLQLVNRPQAVDSLFQVVEMENMDLSKCGFCLERYKIQAMAQIELGEYERAIALLDPISREEDVWMLKKVLLRAHIRQGNYPAAQQLLSTLLLPIDDFELRTHMLLFTAKDFLRQGQESEAIPLLDLAISELEHQPDLGAYRLGECLFYKGDFEQALPLLKSGYEANPLDFNYGALWAIALYNTGNQDEAGRLLERMQALKSDFQYGEIYYSLAQYYGAIGDREKCMEYLLKSISEGHWYETGSYMNDPLLRSYFGEDEFKRVMEYWH